MVKIRSYLPSTQLKYLQISGQLAKDNTTVSNKKGETTLRQDPLHTLSRSLGYQLSEGTLGPTCEPEERSWMRLHAHHLIHPTHEITLTLLLIWVLTPYWLNALLYIVSVQVVPKILERVTHDKECPILCNLFIKPIRKNRQAL